MRQLVAVLLGAVALSACASKETLIAKPSAVPAGTDLSGQWVLRATEGSSQPAARDTLVYVFLETGKSVKVTQTGSALFISFDRSVVEEYRFGEHREISVGEVTAERVSGWEGRTYVVETLDRNGAKLVDSYELEAGGRTLRRSMLIVTGERVQLDLEQVFDQT